MKAAILDSNNIVINMAVVDDQAFADSQGWIVIDSANSPAEIGDEYDAVNNMFTSPPPPPPSPVTTISRRQGKQQLVIAGLDEQVEAAIDGITNTTERKLTRIWYQDANEWERGNLQLLSLASALSLTSTQIDDLFQAASQL